MQRQTRQPLTASEDINEALRMDMASQGTVLPLATIASDEHGALVVMRAIDVAAVLAYVRRPLAGTASPS